jgi:hypothetical protein
MKLGFNFESIQDLTRIIKFVKDENIGVSIDYSIKHMSDDEATDFYVEMIDLEINNLEIILNDMESNSSNFDGIFNFILYVDDNEDNDYFKNPNINLIIDKALNSGFVPRLNMMEVEFRLLLLYNKTQNKLLLKFIIDNLDIFQPDELVSNTFIGTLVKNVDRETFYQTFNDFPDDLKAKYLKMYDDAVKKRVADISAGLGYQGIPNLVLDAIIGETIDTSGMTAYKVDKIIDKFNIWKTDTTMRLGKQQDYQPQFEDAYPQDDDSHDEDVIEI